MGHLLSSCFYIAMAILYATPSPASLNSILSKYNKISFIKEYKNLPLLKEAILNLPSNGQDDLIAEYPILGNAVDIKKFLSDIINEIEDVQSPNGLNWCACTSAPIVERLDHILKMLNDVLKQFPDRDYNLVNVEFAEAKALQPYLFAYGLIKLGYKNLTFYLIGKDEQLRGGSMQGKLRQRHNVRIDLKQYSNGYLEYFQDLKTGKDSDEKEIYKADTFSMVDAHLSSDFDFIIQFGKKSDNYVSHRL